MNGRVASLRQMSMDGTLLNEIDDLLRRYRDRKLTDPEIKRLSEWLPLFFAARHRP